MSKAQLKLTNGFTFSQLFDLEGLRKLDDEFLARLRARDADAHAKLLRYRAGETFAPVERSELLLACAPVLEEQIIDLFGLHDAVTKLRQQTLVHDPIFDFKKQFVLKRARRRLLKKDEYEPFAEIDAWLEAALAAVDAPLRPGSGQAL
ncbi:MAG: hypothetical protein ACJ8LN_03205, partial [Sulfurifustis sp.]